MRATPRINEAVLAKTAARCRERKIVIPTFAEQKRPEPGPGADQEAADQRRAVGRQPAQPLPHHLEERAEGEGRAVQPRQLDRVPARADRRHAPASSAWSASTSPPARTRSAPAFGCLVPRLVTGEFDPDDAEGGLALDRQLLPRRRLRLRAAGLQGHRHPARGHGRERFEWLREIGTDEVIATPGHASRTSRRSTTSAGSCGRSAARDRRSSTSSRSSATPIWHYTMTGAIVEEVFAPDPQARQPAGRLHLGHRLGRHHRRRRLPADEVPARQGRGHRGAAVPDAAARTASARTASRASATSTCPGCTTCATPTWWRPSTTSSACSLLRLFNEEAGASFLAEQGVQGRARRAAAAGGHLRHLQPGGRASRWPSTTSWTGAT